MPEGDDVGGIGHFLVAKNMGVTPDELVGDAIGDVGKGEISRFVRDLRLKDDMEKKVAQLLGKMGRGTGIDGLDHFVALFQHLGLERGRGLFPVPGTAVGGAETRHQAEQPVHRREAGIGFFHGSRTS